MTGKDFRKEGAEELFKDILIRIQDAHWGKDQAQ